MQNTDWLIALIGLTQLLFGIWLGWLRWGRCRHVWTEHWWVAGHYWQCDRCERTVAA